MEKEIIYSYNASADELNVSFGNGFTLLNFLKHLKRNHHKKQEVFSVPLQGEFVLPQTLYKNLAQL